MVATNGDLLAHYEYDPFGNTVAATGVAATDNHFRFSTKYHEDESGLVYYGYRFYSAGLGRFLSRDPIAEAGWLLVRSVDLQFLALQKDTIDTYVFVLNEPVSRVDVLGALSFGGTMFGGPTGIGCGGFLWSIKWQRGPQELTGFIIQEVQYRHVAKDCGGAWLPGYPKQGTFYEAWEIGRHTEKDTFYNASVGKCTYGANWVQGQAAFFWIGSLPGGFWPGRVSEAGSILPSSPDKPWFFGLTRSWISNYITRTLTASWVCCPSGSTTVWTTP